MLILMYTELHAVPTLILIIGISQASNAYLEFLKGPGTKIQFEFVKEMPKPENRLRLDFSSILGTLFFTWVVIQLFPVSMGYL